MFAGLFVFALAIGAAAQQQPETFRVTQIVENDGRTCRVMSVSGRTAKVGCGENGSDIRVYNFSSLTSQAAAYWRRDAERRRQQAELNAAREQTVTFNRGDTVQTPNGRTGKIESFKTDEMAKVQFAPNETQYFMVEDLIKIEPPKPTRNESVENFRVGDTVVNDANQKLKIDSIKGDSAVVRYGVGRYNVYTVKLADLVSLTT